MYYWTWVTNKRKFDLPLFSSFSLKTCRLFIISVSWKNISYSLFHRIFSLDTFLKHTYTHTRAHIYLYLHTHIYIYIYISMYMMYMFHLFTSFFLNLHFFFFFRFPWIFSFPLMWLFGTWNQMNYDGSKLFDSLLKETLHTTSHSRYTRSISYSRYVCISRCLCALIHGFVRMIFCRYF